MVKAGVRIRFEDNALMKYAAWAEARGFAETKPALQMYLDELGGRDEFLRRQARGKDIHRLISQWARGELEGPAVPAEDRRYAAALMSWAEEHEIIPDPNSSERLTCHPEFGYAGRIDCQVRDATGNRVLVEFKTRDVIGQRPELGAADHLQHRSGPVATVCPSEDFRCRVSGAAGGRSLVAHRTSGVGRQARVLVLA